MGLFSSPEFKVGFLVVVVSAIIAGMSLKASNNSAYLGSAKESWFYIDDASGLVKNSYVKMAGIDVGTIRDIKLENGQARVEMVLKGDLPLTKSARIEIRPNGILGDKHVELMSGDPRDPPLRSGEQILVVDDRASVDRLIGEVSKITKSLSAVAENIRSATDGDTDKPLGRIIGNVEQITSDIAGLTKNHGGDLGEIISNLKEATAAINELVNDDTGSGIKQQLQASLRRLDSTMKNVEEISSKVNRGEGTIGKLINDDTTVEEMNSAVSTINNFLDIANRTEISIDYNSRYLARSADAKSFLSLKVQPGLDRYYEIGIVDDPRGQTERTVTTTNTNGTSDTVVNESKRFTDRLRINALFAKNFYDLTLKGGIIESSGGMGVDYYLFKKNLRLSFEAFDFKNLNLRASARYTIFNGIYVIGGAEDMMSKGIGATAFVGAGLFITNDDLKLIITRLPF
jgi:phospholipid/cholesterol/gamma-HCH transport system substrate-binding protein